MTTKAEIQALLRFLAQDAKIPLPLAMAKIKDLQAANLTTPETIAKSSSEVIGKIFTEAKDAKQILNAAKRVSKKRAAGDSQTLSPTKRRKTLPNSDSLVPASIEASLALPSSNADEETLNATILFTNRAPLVLAFAVLLLQYTMPSQPLSSRLSLAQAVVSMNSRSKAVSLGLENGKNAEDEGWGQGQPGVKIMGRLIRVMKRWGYDPKEGSTNDSKDRSVCAEGDETVKIEDDIDLSQSTIKDDQSPGVTTTEEQPAFWGLDLEALRSANGPLSSGRNDSASNLPIYTPQSAHAYILRAFVSAPSSKSVNTASPRKKPSAADVAKEKEHNLGLLLQALDLLYSSWAHVLSIEELDRRAWSWYVAVRPEVENGVAGWGGKGEVRLAQILEMRRKG